MKNFFKKYSLILAIAAAVIFLAIFLTFLFSKVGDYVYIVDMNGSVSVGTSNDVNKKADASIGMKLSTNDIVMTGDKSSCILSYSKKATAKDNFINLGENSQVMIYDKNSVGGYNFFLSYGSLICNMPVDRSYQTNISTRIYNYFADGTITKASYDREDVSGKIFTFDGNPKLQLIQPSGSVSASETLLKNSVCAVAALDDGTVGFGTLNVGFGLNDLTAQDLKIMSGVASTWSERISYGTDEIEAAFQNASDYAKWAVTDPAIITTISELTSASLEPEIVSNESYSSDTGTAVPEVTSESAVVPDVTTEGTTVYTGATQTVPGQTMENDAALNHGAPFTSFSRQTILDLDNEDLEAMTTAPEEINSDNTGINTYTARTTAPYNSETAVEGTSVATGTERATTETAGPVVTEKRPSQTTKRSSGGNAATTRPAGTTKAPTVTTVPPAKVDKNAVFTVIFQYDNSSKEYWSIQLVRYGEAAIEPSRPEVAGKKFIRWDKDFSRVTSDMIINAVFADDNSQSTAKTNSSSKITGGTDGNKLVTTPAATSSAQIYTVKLYVDNQLWKTLTVKEGEDAVVNEVPKLGSGELVFSGWSEDLTNVKSDITAFAMFKIQ